MSGPKVVIDILGDEDDALAALEKTRGKIKEITSTVEAMGRGMNAHSRMAVDAFRSEAKEAERALTVLRATNDEHAKLKRAIAGVETGIAAAGQKYAMATRQMAFGLESVARSGNLAGEGLKMILVQGSEMALMFGGAGPIVGAVAITGLAIYNIFDRTRKEIEATRKKAQEELTRLLKSSSLDVVQQATVDAFAKVGELESKLAAARASEQGALAGVSAVGAGPGAPAGLIQATGDVTRLTDELSNARAAHNKLLERGRAIVSDIVEREQFGLRLAGEREARERAITELAKTRAAILGDLTKLVGESQATGITAPRVTGGQASLKLASAGQIAAIGADAMAKAGDPFSQMTISAVDASSRLTLVSNALGGINSALTDMGAEAEAQFGKLSTVGEVAYASLWEASNQGIQSLIRGHESTAKVLKRAAAEPIVAKLKMKGVEYGKEAVGAFAQLNIPQGIALAAAAAGAFLGAAKVAQIGGVGGGGESAGSGGGAPSPRSGGAGLGAELGGGGRASADQVMRFEIVFINQTPDGREVARITKQIQRNKDLRQPIRVVG
jgi:hypothetical protein